ncbi:MAG: hypothetical protein IPO21_05210 [Bacteroidales bacterium]|nr:hypothetical protein [Bacteroidales bacterium]
MTLTTLTTLLDLLIKNTLTITFFILSMMLLLEYINTFTRGSFSNNLRGRKKTQIIFAAILGVLPGCLGTYTIVSLYTHNMIGIGGLLAVLISTIGDEAYYLLAKSPTLWVVLSLILFVLAIVFGFIVEYFWGKKKALNGKYEEHFVIHKEENYNLSFNNWKDIKHNLTNITFHRAILLFVIVVFMIFVLLPVLDIIIISHYQ